ncbi:MAG: hypothetical protein R3297_07300 [Desulfobulbales bacterium]|nr:hypothetical protein [Desulfobulbales bacterium]
MKIKVISKILKSFCVLFLGVLISLSIASMSAAQVTKKINYQGMLTDSNGNPIDTSSSGPITVTFSIYSETEIGPLWQQSHDIETTDGIFNVILDGGGNGSIENPPLSLNFNQQYWLGVKIGTDEEMTPRQLLTSVPFALMAGEAATAQTVVNLSITNESLADDAVTTSKLADDSVTTLKILNNSITLDDVNFNYAASNAKEGPALDLECTGCVSQAELDFIPNSDGDWTLSGDNLYSAVPGSVGIGETGPSAKLHEVTEANSDIARTAVMGVREYSGFCSATDCPTGHGGYFTANRSNDIAVFGHATATNGGQNFGGRFLADGPTGIGAYGNATNTGPGQNIGGYFKAYGSIGIGVYGLAGNNTGGENFGGWFKADGADGVGVYGLAENTGDNVNYGGWFEAKGVNGRGVRAEVSGANGYAVWGRATNPLGGYNYGGMFSASGLYGVGVHGYADGQNGKGVSGKSEGSQGYGGYFTAIGGGTGLYAKGYPYAAVLEGRIKTNSLEITGGADLSEKFDVRGMNDNLDVEGMVVSIDPENPGSLLVSNTQYDRRVAGIISGAGGVNPGMLMGQDGTGADGASPVALTGRVYAWADTGNGSIAPGDLLTTSDVPGHAMKVTDYNKAQGAILGKAMSQLASGQGLVLVLVTLQ